MLHTLRTAFQVFWHLFRRELAKDAFEAPKPAASNRRQPLTQKRRGSFCGVGVSGTNANEDVDRAICVLIDTHYTYSAPFEILVLAQNNIVRNGEDIGSYVITVCKKEYAVGVVQEGGHQEGEFDG